MNSNLFHNILNGVTALCAVALLPEVGALLNPEQAIAIASTAAAIKLVVNVVRDGFAGMAKPQPPVK